MPKSIGRTTTLVYPGTSASDTGSANSKYSSSALRSLHQALLGALFFWARRWLRPWRCGCVQWTRVHLIALPGLCLRQRGGTSATPAPRLLLLLLLLAAATSPSSSNNARRRRVASSLLRARSEEVARGLVALLSSVSSETIPCPGDACYDRTRRPHRRHCRHRPLPPPRDTPRHHLGTAGSWCLPCDSQHPPRRVTDREAPSPDLLNPSGASLSPSSSSSSSSRCPSASADALAAWDGLTPPQKSSLARVDDEAVLEQEQAQAQLRGDLQPCARAAVACPRAPWRGTISALASL